MQAHQLCFYRVTSRLRHRLLPRRHREKWAGLRQGWVGTTSERHLLNSVM